MQSVQQDREKLACISSSLVFEYIIANILRAETEYNLFLERIRTLQINLFSFISLRMRL
ncbi:hypothetical protein K443DRAFT_677165 [Laccaria amethystina LaAM-08-1]|uniref:Uncharacterized protein n=1 Tax=Laccaria amethystina LaAM-08-1 TaxID=1095629 RepID=A0A0C9Y4L0_9AGAR|nr:hypothetical protein K443DRAFT_677165 [Laccaria amethystina LaAM-08-1]